MKIVCNKNNTVVFYVFFFKYFFWKSVVFQCGLWLVFHYNYFFRNSVFHKIVFHYKCFGCILLSCQTSCYNNVCITVFIVIFNGSIKSFFQKLGGFNQQDYPKNQHRDKKQAYEEPSLKKIKASCRQKQKQTHNEQAWNIF